MNTIIVKNKQLSVREKIEVVDKHFNVGYDALQKILPLIQSTVITHPMSFKLPGLFGKKRICDPSEFYLDARSVLLKGDSISINIRHIYHDVFGNDKTTCSGTFIRFGKNYDNKSYYVQLIKDGLGVNKNGIEDYFGYMQDIIIEYFQSMWHFEEPLEMGL